MAQRPWTNKSIIKHKDQKAIGKKRNTNLQLLSKVKEIARSSYREDLKDYSEKLHKKTSRDNG